MNRINDIEHEAYIIISKNFGIEHSDALTIDDVRNMLAHKIWEMLDKNVEKLLDILYRIDISQKKIDEIFDNLSKDEIAVQIADAVIQRQMLKVKTREMYKNRENNE